MNKTTLLKAGVSVFLVYHLVAVLIMPNQASYLGRHFGQYFYGYASTLGLNTPWQFFSPNPATKLYYEYEIISDNPDAEISKTYRWPPEKENSSLWGPNYKRLIYHSWYTTSSDERKGKFLMHWLCRQHPEADAISLKSFSVRVPSMEKFLLEGKSLEASREVKSWGVESFSCGGESEIAASVE